MKKGTNLALSAIAGAAIGIAAGILTAPKSGKETRDDIKRKVRDVNTQAKGTKDDIHSKVEEAANNARVKASELFGPTNDKDKK